MEGVIMVEFLEVWDYRYLEKFGVEFFLIVVSGFCYY